jgi:hypothetical protein
MLPQLWLSHECSPVVRLPDGRFIYFGRNGWVPYRDALGATYSSSVCTAAEFAAMWPEAFETLWPDRVI